MNTPSLLMVFDKKNGQQKINPAAPGIIDTHL